MGIHNRIISRRKKQKPGATNNTQSNSSENRTIPTTIFSENEGLIISQGNIHVIHDPYLGDVFIFGQESKRD